MKRFAILMFLGLPTTADAQSVLERVLGKIDNSVNMRQVNGTYANIAENITSSTTKTETVYEAGGVSYTQAEYDALLSAKQAEAATTAATAAGSAIIITYQDRDGLGPLGAGYYVGDPTAATANPAPSGTWHDSLDAAKIAVGISPEILLVAQVATGVPLTYSYQINGAGPTFTSPTDAISSATATLTRSLLTTFEASFTLSTREVQVPGDTAVINGSIKNTITGLTTATAKTIAGLSAATEFTLPTLDMGDMATTVLGAVNTGDIALGVNAATDEAKTTTAAAISVAATQIGGTADSGALVLNIAHNAMIIDGSIRNTMTTVNGSVGSLSTTTLGAVNTGSIAAGVGAVVQGITGMAGQPSS